MTFQEITRVFMYKDQPLADPDPQKTPDEVRRHYTPMYADLVNASIKGPSLKDGKQIYTFTTNVGVKG